MVEKSKNIKPLIRDSFYYIFRRNDAINNARVVPFGAHSASSGGSSAHNKACLFRSFD
jgi:hypothetical protein